MLPHAFVGYVGNHRMRDLQKLAKTLGLKRVKFILLCFPYLALEAGTAELCVRAVGETEEVIEPVVAHTPMPAIAIDSDPCPTSDTYPFP